jgi:hypothetical protein
VFDVVVFQKQQGVRARLGSEQMCIRSSILADWSGLPAHTLVRSWPAAYSNAIPPL